MKIFVLNKIISRKIFHFRIEFKEKNSNDESIKDTLYPSSASRWKKSKLKDLRRNQEKQSCDLAGNNVV
ncbi:hypothetical protein K0M31_014563 [Melipona bicolor]|uniref:Uncharacterized protein n=1 Tax=Melipona bicolor TaxID=60889 RepID=A0AA40G8T4_9HYME|nr:hypothetical protein K0M31_014563 [Melipona bicolor]